MLLQAVLQDRVQRRALLSSSTTTTISTELSLKLRFCCAMEDYAAEKDARTKKQRGLKVVSTFVVAGSLFQLENVPKELTAEGKLGQLHQHVLDELALVPEIAANLVTETAEAAAAVVAQRDDKEEQKEHDDDEDDDDDDETAAPPQRLPSIANVKLSRHDPLTVKFYDMVISPKFQARRSLLPTLAPLLPPPVFSADAATTITKEQQLERAIADPVVRRDLILKLVSEQLTELSIKVRLCQAITDYFDNTPTAHKQARGRKIVSVFIQPGSMFCVSGIADDVFHALVVAQRYDDALPQVKTALLDELLQCAVVQQEQLKLAL